MIPPALDCICFFFLHPKKTFESEIVALPYFSFFCFSTLILESLVLQMVGDWPIIYNVKIQDLIKAILIVTTTFEHYSRD